MPSAAHIFAGLVVGLLLYQVSQKKFTPYHIMLFSVQGIIGPDLGWLFPSDNVAHFFHSTFGFAVVALALAIPFLYLGRAIKVPLRYSDTYKLTVAGGLVHTCIDGLGHWNSVQGLGSFSLFSFDVVEYFFQTPKGLGIFAGSLGIFVLGTGIAYHRFHKGSGGDRNIALKDTTSAMAPFPLVIGVLLLLRLMPFGDVHGFSLTEALYNTGYWSGVGGSGNIAWLYVTSIIFLIATIVAAKKAPRWVIPLLIGFAVTILLVLAFVPAAGGGEADLGMIYFLLLFVAVPGLLLGTSFRKDIPK